MHEILRGGSWLGDVSVPRAELEGLLTGIHWAGTLAQLNYEDWQQYLQRSGILFTEADFYGTAAE